jgi:hypothetical protein
MPIGVQLHLALIQYLVLLLPLVVVMVAENPITVEMERLVVLAVEEGLMQLLHKVVLELPDKVIMGAQCLAQITVNLVVAVVLVLLEELASTKDIEVEMVVLDWFHLFQAHQFNTLVAAVVVKVSISEVME